MKYKSLKILLPIFGGLVVIAVIYIGLEQRPSTRKLFTNKEFNRIEVSRSEDTTPCVFEKTGEEWRIVEPIDYPVDSNAFYSFLRGLKDLELGEVVSKRKVRHRDFEVDEQGIKVKVYWDNREKSFILGKRAGDFMHWYLRISDRPETYLSKGLSKYLVDKKTDEWRDKTIFSFNPKEVEELVLDGKKIERSDTLWKMGEEIIEEKKVKQVLDVLKNLRADGFGTEEFNREFEVKIMLEGGEKVIYIGEKTENKYPAKVRGKPTIFLLNSWKVDRLKKLT